MNQESRLETITETLIVPVYKNAENIPALMEALKDIAAERGKLFEVVFAVDGSPDDSHALLSAALPSAGFSSCLVSFNKNAGASAAIRTVLRYARGECIAIMSADLQEPSELISRFFEALGKDSADIVFGQRIRRDDSFPEMFLSRLYWGFYRRYVMTAIPSGGADVFAFNGRIKKALLEREASSGLLVLQLFRMEARRLFIPYKRLKRKAGKSAWSFRKKLASAAASMLHYASYRLLFLLWLAAFGSAAVLLSAALPYPGLLFAACVLLAGFATLGCFRLRSADRSGRSLPVIDSIKYYANEKE